MVITGLSAHLPDLRTSPTTSPTEPTFHAFRVSCRNATVTSELNSSISVHSHWQQAGTTLTELMETKIWPLGDYNHSHENDCSAATPILPKETVQANVL